MWKKTTINIVALHESNSNIRYIIVQPNVSQEYIGKSSQDLRQKPTAKSPKKKSKLSGRPKPNRIIRWLNRIGNLFTSKYCLYQI